MYTKEIFYVLFRVTLDLLEKMDDQVSQDHLVLLARLVLVDHQDQNHQRDLQETQDHQVS